MTREIKFRAFYNNRMHKNEEALRLLYNNSAETKIFHTDHPIMQYTGLKDKNGVEIYEGDIIKIRWIEMIYQTHTGDNIIFGSYTEPDYIKIFEADYEVIFNNGVFCINTNDMEPPLAFGDPNNALTSFLFPWWEQMPDVDFSDISDDYFEDEGFETIKELSSTLGCEIIGNIHDNPELL